MATSLQDLEKRLGRRRHFPYGKLTVIVLFFVGVWMVYTGYNVYPLKPRAVWYPGTAYQRWMSAAFRIRTDPFDSRYVWVASNEGVRLLDKVTQAWKSFGIQDGLPSDQIAALDFDKNYIWVATWKGLARIIRKTGKVECIGAKEDNLQRRLTDIWVIDEMVWLGSLNDGLIGFNMKDSSAKAYSTNNGLASRSVYSILIQYGKFYLGHDSGRVSVGSPEESFHRLVLPVKGLQKQTIIWDLLPLGKELWMATADKGIWQYDFSQKTLREHRPLIGTDSIGGAYCLVADSSAVFAGTAFGVFRFDRKANFWIPLPEEGEENNRREILSLELLQSDSIGSFLWYGSRGRGVGIAHLDRVFWYEYAAGLNQEGVMALEPMGSLLWTSYGYQGGYVDVNTQDLVFLRNHNFWLGEKIRDVAYLQSYGSRLFAGGQGGLATFNMADSNSKNKVPKWRNFFQVNQRNLQDVNTVLPFGSEFLVGTGHGLFRYNPRQDTLFEDSTLGEAYVGMLERWRPDSSAKPFILAGTLTQGVVLLQQKKSVDSALAIGLQVLAKVGEGQIVNPRSAAWLNANTLWIGAQNGLFSLHLDSNISKCTLSVVTGFPSPSFVTSLLSVGDNIWVGSRQKGLYVFNRKNKMWVLLNSENVMQNDKIYSLKSSSKYLWIGDALGYCRFQKDSLSFLISRGQKL